MEPLHLPRTGHIAAIQTLLETTPAVAILGARQVGKTTLAQQIVAGWDGPTAVFDLERPADLNRLLEAELALERLRGLVVLDEIQRRPDLFPVLRGLIDRSPERRFLILGSASPDLLRQSSESLAGRIAYHDLPPLWLGETGVERLDDVWLRGGFPRSLLAPTQSASFRWRLDFVRTFIERDLPSLGSRVPSATTDRFWRMLAHVHGQTWNSARFASSFGVTDTTVRRYLDLLTSALVVRRLMPWHQNVGKRQVRSPKVYVVDSGLLHTLLDLQDRTAVERHPILGASWEGFVLAQLDLAMGSRPEQRYFWATHAGAELDYLVVRGNTRVGVEVKRTTTPKVSRSLRTAIETLELDRAYVVHAGDHSYPLADGIEAVAAVNIASRKNW